MIKRMVAAASISALMLAPALAQSNDQAMKPNAAPLAQTPNAAPSNTVPSAETTSSTASSPSEFLRTQGPDEWLSSDLLGAVVRGAANQSIGEIEDVVIDGAGTVKAVVISVGGFLGMGEKSVAVPMHAIKITRDGDEIEKIVVNYTKEQLEQAPAFQYAARDDAWDSDDSTTGYNNR